MHMRARARGGIVAQVKYRICRTLPSAGIDVAAGACPKARG